MRPSFFARASSLVLLPLAVIVACSDPPTRPAVTGQTGLPTPPPPVGSGSGTEAGTPDADARDAGEGGICSELLNTGPLVDRLAVIGDPPISTGGTIVEGTYDLTDYTVYIALGGLGGPTGVTAKSTISVTGNEIEQITETGGNTPVKVERKVSAYSVNGSAIAMTAICPAAGVSTIRQFTASDSRLILTDQTLKETFTFTLR